MKLIITSLLGLLLTTPLFATEPIATLNLWPGKAPGEVKELPKEGFLESTTDIPEPHEFDLTLTLFHDGHAHPSLAQFREHDHGHTHYHDHGDLPKGAEFQDAHEAVGAWAGMDIRIRGHRDDYATSAACRAEPSRCRFAASAATVIQRQGRDCGTIAALSPPQGRHP